MGQELKHFIRTTYFWLPERSQKHNHQQNNWEDRPGCHASDYWGRLHNQRWLQQQLEEHIGTCIKMHFTTKIKSVSVSHVNFKPFRFTSTIWKSFCKQIIVLVTRAWQELFKHIQQLERKVCRCNLSNCVSVWLSKKLEVYPWSRLSWWPSAVLPWQSQAETPLGNTRTPPSLTKTHRQQ